MTKYYILLIFSIISVLSFSQDEDESCKSPSKKTLKLIETAKKSPDAKSAVVNFTAAIESAPDNAMAYYEYGIDAYNQAMKLYESNPNPAVGDKSMVKSEEMLAQALEFCSDYHANCHYYLGVINYSQKEMDLAISHFKNFVAYDHSDVSRFDLDHDKKLQDVKEVLKELEGEKEMKTKEVPFSPVKVPNVSSKNDEYFPMISPDNELMFYTRKLDRKNLGDILSNVVEEFTFSQRKDMNDLFDSGQAFNHPFNDGSFASYGAATMSVDNKEMIICACKSEMVGTQNYMNCDLYITTFKRSGKGGNDFEWTPLENMGPGINTKNGWEAQPSLSADGNTLFYTAYGPHTRDNDIYVATRDSKGNWSDGRPLDEINTDGKDKSPFLHQDSETLYFVSTSSDERKGFGGTDIYYSRMENGKWGKPVNIGSPINTKDDEIGIFVSTDGKLAYYSSRVGGDWNIFSFELYEEARPKSVALIKGELKDKAGNPVQDAVIELAYTESGTKEKIKVNGDDGKYAAIVKTEKAQDIVVTVKKEGHAFDSKLISKEEIKGKTAIKGNDLAVRPLKAGEAYTINDILFNTSSYALNKKSEFILKQFAEFLKENPSIVIMIQGHTDDVGDDAKNLKLSEQRAQEVKKFLVAQGIKDTRLKAKGFGETVPKVANDSEYNRAINRRTDFMIEKL
jgi:outer membrane protein OmpA-like peptidoglycan-associated protein/tetratricopeptide (TPR) repeat protein